MVTLLPSCTLPLHLLCPALHLENASGKCPCPCPV